MDELNRSATTTRRLVLHAAFLWVVLLALMPLIGIGTGPLITDEGAFLMQLDSLNERGQWRSDYPLADLDPAGAYVPLAYSRHLDGEIIAYSSRPAYVLVNLGPSRFGGIWGVSALGTLTVAITAFSVGAVVRLIHPPAAILGLWLVGLGSPLLFHGFILQGHSFGAASVAVAFLVACRVTSRPRQAWLAATVVSLTIMGGALVRREVIFVALGLAAWGAFQALFRRRSADLITGVGALIGASASLGIDRLLTQGSLGTAKAPNIPVLSPDSLSLLEGRLLATHHSLLRTTFDELATVDNVALIGLVITIAGAIRLRRHREEPLLYIGMGVLGLTALFRIMVHDSPPLVPGILMASPALFIGCLLVPRELFRRRETEMVAVAAVFAIVGVSATQYQGTWEWGARFLMIAVPSVGVLSAVGWATAVNALPPIRARVLSGALMTTVLAFGLLAVFAQRDGRMAVEELRATITAEASPGTVIASTELWMPRYDTAQLGDVEYRWAHATENNLANLLEHLAERGITHVIVPGRSERDIPAIATSSGWETVTTRPLPRLRWSLTMWELVR